MDESHRTIKNDKQTIFGWCMYDWANSAYATTVAAALLQTYLAKVIVGAEGVQIGNTNISATSLWGYMVASAAFLSFLVVPVLGPISDFSSSKKKFLLFFAYTGSLFTTLLYFCQAGDVWQTVLIFIICQVGFVGANVFYDGFLPQLVSEDKLDWLSAKGVTFGFIGGGTQFALALSLVAGHGRFGIDQVLATRLAITMAGFWWAGFTVFTLKHLKESGNPEQMTEKQKSMPALIAYVTISVQRTLATTRKVRRFKHLLLFLVAFTIYNDGVQTVVSMAFIYGTEEIGLSTTAMMVTFLAIQIVASVGAPLFSRLARRIGTKQSVMLSLVLWSAIVTYAFFLRSAAEFFVLGICVGIVLGGTQALSRSLYGSMVPEEASAEFYGFYSVFSKFSAIWGPLAFAIIRQLTGTARLSIIALMIFFIVGFILLSFVDTEKARQARFLGAF